MSQMKELSILKDELLDALMVGTMRCRRITRTRGYDHVILETEIARMYKKIQRYQKDERLAGSTVDSRST